MPRAVSFSGLMTYEKCPAQYDYKYNQGLRDDGPGPAAARGTQVHKSIEDYYLNDGELHDAIPIQMRKVICGPKDTCKEVYPELAFSFTENWEPTEFEAEDAFVRGYMDNVIVNPDKLLVHEYKTGSIYPEHEDQKALYALASLLLFPDYDTVEVQGIYIDKKKVVPSTYGRVSITSMKFMWAKRINKVHLNIYPARPGLHCRWCVASKAKGGPCQVG